MMTNGRVLWGNGGWWIGAIMVCNGFVVTGCAMTAEFGRTKRRVHNVSTEKITEKICLRVGCGVSGELWLKGSRVQ